jgi:flagellar protein FlgJ
MTDAIGGRGTPRHASAASAKDDPRAKLRKASQDLESVFVNELFKAMRQTVPDEGILSQDPGQDLFTGMLDERIAQSYAGQGKTGIGDALYHQLSRRLPDAGSASGAP